MLYKPPPNRKIVTAIAIIERIKWEGFAVDIFL
jgi:hypothetical protein